MKLINPFKSRRSLLGLLCMALVGGIGSFTLDSSGGVALATLGMFGIPLRKEDKANENGGGGGAISDDEFRTKTLEGVTAIRSQFETIEQNFKTLDKDAKKTSEDFANHCKTFEGLPNQVVAIERSIAQIELKVKQERRSHFGSSVELISGDAQLKAAFNGIIRSNYNVIVGGGVTLTEDQKKGAEDFKRALTGGTSPGSTYINAELLPAIYSTIAEYGMWRKFDVIPVRTSSAKMIVDSTDPIMYWTAEGVAPTEGAPTGVQVTATINKLLGWIGISRELLDDAEIDLTGHTMRKFANATAYALDFACTSADGGADTTDGGFTGVFGGSATASVAVTGNVSVATLDLEDFLNCMLAVDPAVLSRPTTGWLIHPQMLVRLLSIKDLNGRPIFLPSTDAPALGAIGTILGFPVHLCYTANATDGVSKRICVFGDLMGQAVCLRNDFEFAASDQAKFTEDLVVFRARARAAAKTKKATAFAALTTAAS